MKNGLKVSLVSEGGAKGGVAVIVSVEVGGVSENACGHV